MEIKEVIERLKSVEVSIPTLCLTCSTEWDDDSGYYDHLSGNRDKTIEDEFFTIEYKLEEDDVDIDDGCLLDYSLTAEVTAFYNSVGEEWVLTAEEMETLETALSELSEMEIE